MAKAQALTEAPSARITPSSKQETQERLQANSLERVSSDV